MNKNAFRLALIGAVTAAVALPLIVQMQKSTAQSAAAPQAEQPSPAAAAAAPGATPPVLPTTLPGPQVDPATKVVTAGDVTVTAGEVSSTFSQLPPQVQAQLLSRPDAKRLIADKLLTIKLLANEARKRGLQNASKTQDQISQVLAQAFMEDVAVENGADEKYFKDNKDFFDEVKARHILIATTGSPVPGATLNDAQAKAKAEQLRQRIEKGEDFAKLARDESDDKGSGAQGGDLGTVSRGQMVPPFDQAAFGLKKGELSQPVRTEYGYHLIQVQDRIPTTFEASRQRVAQRRIQIVVEDLKKHSDPQFDESFFGAAAGAATKPAIGSATTQPAPTSAPATQAAVE